MADLDSGRLERRGFSPGDQMNLGFKSGMTPVLRNAITMLGFCMCLFDVQIQDAQNNLFAGNFMPNQEMWLTGLRYGLCGAALILSAVLLASSPSRNLGERKHGFIFMFLILFSLITSIRSAMDMGNGLYLLATGSRHILSFILVAMASSLPRQYNFARPMLIGALPAYVVRSIFATYQYIIGEGVEITGGVRSLALDTGFLIFGLFFLYVAVHYAFENLNSGSSRNAFFWILIAIPLLFFPLASFRRSMIVLTVAPLIFGFMIQSYANGNFIRRLLPLTAICAIIAAISAAMFISTFGGDAAIERFRSFAIHDEGAFAGSNGEYERDFDYAADLIKRNPINGIGFSTSYGFAGRDSETLQEATGVQGEVVLHVGLQELVARQGIWGALVWLLAFIWIPLRRIQTLRQGDHNVALIPCFTIALFILIANFPTSPPFYNEIRPAVFLGMSMGIAFADDPVAVFQPSSAVLARARQLWARKLPGSDTNSGELALNK